MKNWEEIYNEYKQGEIKKHYEELKIKVNEKKTTADEYKEFQKMTKIMENLPKVENIIDYKNKLDKNLEILKQEYTMRDSEERVSNLKEKLEKDMAKNLNKQDEILKEKKDITKKLNDKTLSQEERKTLEEKATNLDKELGTLRKEAQDNNEKFLENENINKDIQKNKDLSKLSKEEIRQKCFMISSMISKCNMVGSQLMKGVSKENIELKLKDWKDRKFTSKTPLPLTRKEQKNRNPKNDIIKEDKESKIKEESIVQPVINKQDKIEEKIAEQKESAIIELNEFEKAFPTLSKFMPKFFKNSKIAKKIANWKNDRYGTTKNDEVKIADKEEVKNKQQQEKEVEVEETKIVENKRDKFVDYLKYDFDILKVAENGIDKLEKERQEILRKKRQDLQEKIKKEREEQNDKER